MLARKFLNIIEHVSYSMGYCKLSLLIYAGNSSLSNTRPFLTQLLEMVTDMLSHF